MSTKVQERTKVSLYLAAATVTSMKGPSSLGHIYFKDRQEAEAYWRWTVDKAKRARIDINARRYEEPTDIFNEYSINEFRQYREWIERGASS